jgi:hypothetical protein
VIDETDEEKEETPLQYEKRASINSPLSRANI